MLMLKQSTYQRNKMIFDLSDTFTVEELAARFKVKVRRIRQIIQHFEVWGEFA